MKTLIALLLLAATVQAEPPTLLDAHTVALAESDGTTYEWRWAHDEPFSHDKYDHASIAFILTTVTAAFLHVPERDEWQLIAGAAVATFSWESFDAMVAWSPDQPHGGDGWSWCDVAANAVGVTAALLIR